MGHVGGLVEAFKPLAVPLIQVITNKSKQRTETRPRSVFGKSELGSV
jgi:hypothetical protein